MCDVVGRAVCVTGKVTCLGDSGLVVSFVCLGDGNVTVVGCCAIGFVTVSTLEAGDGFVTSTLVRIFSVAIFEASTVCFWVGLGLGSAETGDPGGEINEANAISF